MYTPTIMTRQPYYIDLVSTGTDGERVKFINGENLSMH